jgi:hypothetical protein
VIALYGALAIAVILLGLLFVLVIRGDLYGQESEARSDLVSAEEESGSEICPPEFVPLIFGPRDQEYVSALRCSGLEELFRRERKEVAIFWIQQTFASIRRIMKSHVQATRSAADLRISTEINLFGRYVELFLLCSLLLAFVKMVGPSPLGQFAAEAERLSQRIGEAEQAFRTAVSEGSVQAIGS